MPRFSEGPLLLNANPAAPKYLRYFLNFRSRFSKDLRSLKVFMKRTAACRMDAIDQPGCRHLFLRRGLWRSFEEVCSSALTLAILRKSFRRPERSPCPNKSIRSVVPSGPTYIYSHGSSAGRRGRSRSPTVSVGLAYQGSLRQFSSGYSC